MGFFADMNLIANTPILADNLGVITFLHHSTTA
jgi:hypothetical protein